MTVEFTLITLPALAGHQLLPSVLAPTPHHRTTKQCACCPVLISTSQPPARPPPSPSAQPPPRWWWRRPLGAAKPERAPAAAGLCKTGSQPTAAAALQQEQGLHQAAASWCLMLSRSRRACALRRRRLGSAGGGDRQGGGIGMGAAGLLAREASMRYTQPTTAHNCLYPTPSATNNAQALAVPKRRQPLGAHHYLRSPVLRHRDGRPHPTHHPAAPPRVRSGGDVTGWARPGDWGRGWVGQSVVDGWG